MSPNKLHSIDENAWHAEIFCSLRKENVTPAELGEMAVQMKTGVIPLKHAKIHRILNKHGALKELPELAMRCAMVPELLMEYPPLAFRKRRLRADISSVWRKI